MKDLVASFAPILLALPLAILIQIQSSTIRQLLPFYMLSRSNDAGEVGGVPVSAGQSLCLTTGGLQGLVNSMELLFKYKDPLLFLVDLQVLVSSLVVSFSSEAMGIKLYGHCQPDNFTGCRMGVAVFRQPGRMAEAFLGACLVINIVLNGWLIRRSGWKRAHDIYSRQGGTICGAGSLLDGAAEQTRYYFQSIAGKLPNGIVSNKDADRHFNGYLFSIRTIIDGKSSPEHQPNHYYLAMTTGDVSSKEQSDDRAGEKRSWHEALLQVFTSRHQEMINQVPFILAVIGFLIMLFYYELTSTTSAFEQFMNSQGLGVRALFAGLGIIISLFWDNHFSNVATQETYRQIQAGQGQPSILALGHLKRSTTTPIPTTAFNALFQPLKSFMFRAAACSLPGLLLTLVATITALSKITPLLLSNVPYSPWLTWETHEACTWSAIAIMILMMIVLFYGMVDVFRQRNKGRTWVEVDLATVDGKMVFWILYCTDTGESSESDTERGKF